MKNANEQTDAEEDVGQRPRGSGHRSISRGPGLHHCPVCAGESISPGAL